MYGQSALEMASVLVLSVLLLTLLWSLYASTVRRVLLEKKEGVRAECMNLYTQIRFLELADPGTEVIVETTRPVDYNGVLWCGGESYPSPPLYPSHMPPGIHIMYRSGGEILWASP